MSPFNPETLTAHQRARAFCGRVNVTPDTQVFCGPRSAARRAPRWVAVKLALLFVLASTSPVLSDQSHTASVHETTKWLSAVPTRIVGSESHDRIVTRLQQEIRALSNVRLWTHSFPVVMPQIEKAVLQIEQGSLTGRHRIYPIWPAGVRLNTTPKEGIGGKLIYIGQATANQIPARSLQRQVAVMELSGGKGWRLAASLGASAIILLDDGHATQLDAATHFVNTLGTISSWRQNVFTGLDRHPTPRVYLESI